MQNNHKLSCVIAAFNEAPRIGGVLDIVTHHPLVDEVIVVNDGSRDNTEEVLRKRSDITVISLEKNKGKSNAVREGIMRATGDTIMLLDADLGGLTEDAVTTLIDPVIKDQADITLSMRGNSLSIYKFLGLDFVSGERVFAKSLIKDLSDLGRLKGFGLESYINRIIIEKKLRMCVVNWPHVMQARKQDKYGFWEGTLVELHMMKQVVSFLGPVGMIKQFVQMSRLKQ